MMDGILISETFIILYIYQTTVHRPLQHENKIDSGRRFLVVPLHSQQTIRVE